MGACRPGGCSPVTTTTNTTVAGCWPQGQFAGRYPFGNPASGSERRGAPADPWGASSTGKYSGKRMNMKRMRGRNHRPGGGGGGGGGGNGGGPVRHQSGNTPLNRNHVFDSSGPDVRVRGTSQQLFEKYLQMGRDATSSGDRVMAEGYFQHAEHYFRILNAMNQAAQQSQPAGQAGPQHGGPRRFQNDGEFNPGQPGQGFDGDEGEGGNEPRSDQRNGPTERPEKRATQRAPQRPGGSSRARNSGRNRALNPVRSHAPNPIRSRLPISSRRSCRRRSRRSR